MQYALYFISPYFFQFLLPFLFIFYSLSFSLLFLSLSLQPYLVSLNLRDAGLGEKGTSLVISALKTGKQELEFLDLSGNTVCFIILYCIMLYCILCCILLSSN